MSELCVYDWDNTIRPGTLSGDAILHGIESGIFDPSRFVDPANPSYDEVPYFAETLVGQSRRVFQELLDRLADESGSKMYEWATERMAGQDHILVLSHGPDFLVRAAARGVPAITHARGTFFHTQELVFSGRMTTLDKGKALKRYKRERGLQRVTFGAGDSMNDLPLLEAAETAVVVNPHGELAQIATDRGWEIVQTDQEKLS